MNCANHPERTATAFCQNCGKALCPECTRSADGLLLCEPCLVSRHPDYVPGQTIPGSAGATGSGQMPFTPVPNAAGQYPPAAYVGRPSPFLAGLLGFIPGVGAMYNGQFLKGLVHVVIFIVLIGISAHIPLFGILIAAWVFYQVFDAVHTATARRDGLPLPDPFGILDLSHRMGPNAAYSGSTAPGYVPPVNPGYRTPPPSGTVPPAANYSAPYTPPAAGYSAPGQASPGQASPFTPVNGGYGAVPPEAYYRRRRGEPIGAVILIGLGVLFLLNTLDVLDFNWISRGWPVFLLALGVWLLIRRTTSRSGYVPGPPSPAGNYTGGNTPAGPAPGTSLSIYPTTGPIDVPAGGATGERKSHSEEENS
jgi:TM2 domain-containing membrane protein YozV